MKWAEEWSKEGWQIDWQKLVPRRGFEVLPRGSTLSWSTRPSSSSPTGFTRVPRAGLTLRTVVKEAARIADEVGLDRFTLALVAQRLGMALPSLYKQLRSLDVHLQKHRPT